MSGVREGGLRHIWCLWSTPSIKLPPAPPLRTGPLRLPHSRRDGQHGRRSGIVLSPEAPPALSNASRVWRSRQDRSPCAPHASPHAVAATAPPCRMRTRGETHPRPHRLISGGGVFNGGNLWCTIDSALPKPFKRARKRGNPLIVGTTDTLNRRHTAGVAGSNPASPTTESSRKWIPLHVPLAVDGALRRCPVPALRFP